MATSSHLTHCPICRSRRVNYAFSKDGIRATKCVDCGFLFLNPQPTEAKLQEIYRHDYFFGSDDEKLRQHGDEMKNATARAYMDELGLAGITCGRLLEVGCGHGHLLQAAESRGFDVIGIDYSEHASQVARSKLQRGTVLVGELDDQEIADNSIDVCVLADVIEHVRDPRTFLDRLWMKLKPGGCLLIATPTLDSWSAHLMGGSWMEYKVEHMSYFSRRTLESLLWQTSFNSVHFRPGRKTTSLEYVAGHFGRFPVRLWSPLVKMAAWITPPPLRRRPIRITGSGLLAIAFKASRRRRPLLSIIVPAFNEGPTIQRLLAALVAKEIDGIDKEIIVVESNSTDGTREIVNSFASHPEVRVILEEGPRGKGAATRNGLAAARGDVIMIQDADLEYDLEDYDALIEPILAGREPFMLGARHGGRTWKLRHYADQPVRAFALNLAHGVFTALINVSHGVWLRDPFTMYKVFRRDCIAGLTFTRNRFDFDWELLIKLIRKGYRPKEIPVNYRSRSFGEGKKIRIFRDPITWIVAWASATYRPMQIRITPESDLAGHEVHHPDGRSQPAPALKA